MAALFSALTHAGLTLRATGENPEAVFASGVDPMQVRIIAVVPRGAIAGMPASIGQPLLWDQ